jgi:hypothetical protein
MFWNFPVSLPNPVYVTRIAAMRNIFTRIGCTLLTCDMYMSDLRHIHNPVLSSLKMEGIRLVLFIVFCLLLLSNGINVDIGHTCNTMWVYHDTIITCATADSFCSLFPYPQNPRFHTCAYVTHMKDNDSRSIEIRQVICDTRISNCQWPRRDVTNLCGACAVRWPRIYEISGR